MVACAELCAERGYAEMSAAQIAARAGLSVDEFDTIFKGGKEECMVAVVDTILSGVVSDVSSNYSADRSERESYLLAIHAILKSMAATPSFAYVTYIGSRQLGSEKVTKVHEAGIRVLVMMLERLWEHSGADVQPARAARGALGGPEAVVRRELTAGRVERLPALLPDFVYAATVPFLGQEEALWLARRARELLEGD